MRPIRALVGGLLAATLLLPVAASAQTGGEVDITDVNLARYRDGGVVTMVVEFRNLDGPLDPALLTPTVNGQPVEPIGIDPIDQFTVARGVVLVIDKSGSMEGEPMEGAKAAARAFVESKRPEDFIALVTFDDEVTVLSNFTNSASTLVQRIDSITAEGGTAMFDAVVRATELYGGASDNLLRNMIVLSDGLDENSTAGLQQAIAAVEASGVRTFGVALQSESFAPDDLGQIVTAGEGSLLTTTNPGELAGLYGQIQRELNNSLVVRFQSPVTSPEEVTFGIQYGDLQASFAAQVPGFVTTTTAGEAPTTTFAMAEPVVIQDPLPVDRGTMLILIVVAVAAAIALLIFILLGGNREEGPEFAKRLAAYGRRGGLEEERRPFLERIPLLNRFTARAEEEVRKRGLLSPLNASLEQGNVPLSAGEAIAAGFGLALVAGLLAGLFTFSLVTAAVVAGVVVVVMFAAIKFIGSREKRRFESQLPDTLTLISTSLRAGYSLLQAVEAVAQEAPNPTAREFSRAIVEARLGIPVTEALNGITERTQSEDFRWAVMAIEIQREVGGNLAEVLQTVADTMMARNRLKGEIRALTAEGRISAIVLGSLPFAMALFLWTTNREYLQPLLDNTFGLIAIGVGVVLMAGGIIWLRKIVNIEV